MSASFLHSFERVEQKCLAGAVLLLRKIHGEAGEQRDADWVIGQALRARAKIIWQQELTRVVAQASACRVEIRLDPRPDESGRCRHERESALLGSL